eukprot:GHUV01003670.1.p1 GENE.GHUV01003670.1~~GHUV01003670.1.p1  ORF type:complete len:190 (+),score=59.27 GHUV01003670.1:84-653(+)
MRRTILLAFVLLLASGSQARVLLQGTSTNGSSLQEATTAVRNEVTNRPYNAGQEEKQIESAAIAALAKANADKATVPEAQAVQQVTAAVQQQTGGSVKPATEQAIKDAVAKLYSPSEQATGAAAPGAAAACDAALYHISEGVLGNYWDHRKRYADRMYKGLEPSADEFQHAELQQLSLATTLTVEQLVT